MQTLIYFTACAICFSTFVQASIPSSEPHHFIDSQRKLDLFTSNTGWDFFTEDEPSQTASDLKLEFIARGPVVLENSSQPTLTLRIDQSEARSSRIYAEKWLREFPKFGFELQTSKETSYGSLEGYEMDLKSNFSDRQIRQFVVKKPHEMWVFTCSSDRAHFENVARDCEKILKTSKTTL